MSYRIGAADHMATIGRVFQRIVQQVEQRPAQGRDITPWGFGEIRERHHECDASPVCHRFHQGDSIVYHRSHIECLVWLRFPLTSEGEHVIDESAEPVTFLADEPDVFVALAGAIGDAGFEVLCQQSHGSEGGAHFVGNGGHKTGLAARQFDRPQGGAAGEQQSDGHCQPGHPDHSGHEVSRLRVAPEKHRFIGQNDLSPPWITARRGENFLPPCGSHHDFASGDNSKAQAILS